MNIRHFLPTSSLLLASTMLVACGDEDLHGDGHHDHSFPEAHACGHVGDEALEHTATESRMDAPNIRALHTPLELSVPEDSDRGWASFTVTSDGDYGFYHIGDASFTLEDGSGDIVSPSHIELDRDHCAITRFDIFHLQVGTYFLDIDFRENTFISLIVLEDEDEHDHDHHDHDH